MQGGCRLGRRTLRALRGMAQDAPIRPDHAHPLFHGFVEAALKRQEEQK